MMKMIMIIRMKMMISYRLVIYISEYQEKKWFKLINIGSNYYHLMKSRWLMNIKTFVSCVQLRIRIMIIHDDILMIHIILCHLNYFLLFLVIFIIITNNHRIIIDIIIRTFFLFSFTLPSFLKVLKMEIPRLRNFFLSPFVYTISLVFVVIIIIWSFR